MERFTSTLTDLNNGLRDRAIEFATFQNQQRKLNLRAKKVIQKNICCKTPTHLNPNTEHCQPEHYKKKKKTLQLKNIYLHVTIFCHNYAIANHKFKSKED